MVCTIGICTGKLSDHFPQPYVNKTAARWCLLESSGSGSYDYCCEYMHSEIKSIVALSHSMESGFSLQKKMKAFVEVMK